MFQTKRLYPISTHKRTGTFHRKQFNTRGRHEEWDIVAEDVKMYLRPRRPAASSAIPEVEYSQIQITEENEWWARILIPLFNLEIGDRLRYDRLSDDEVEDVTLRTLYIFKTEIHSGVHHLTLSIQPESV